VKQKIYSPTGMQKMNILCFISGSGTNYREIAAANPRQNYIVFTNRPGCDGIKLAKQNGHEILELSHIPFLKEARQRYGAGKVPRNCTEREVFDKKVSELIDNKLGKKPDLICLAGYDQWTTDWLVARYYPRMLNVHPGDSTRGYSGLHWVPAAKAILAGESSLRTTLFIVDKGEDTGPVIAQSRPMVINETLSALETRSFYGLHSNLKEIQMFARENKIRDLQDFQLHAPEELKESMVQICSSLQDALKVAGDWKIYPFAVHELIAKGRAEVEERTVFVDGEKMPVWGFRPDEHNC